MIRALYPPSVPLIEPEVVQAKSIHASGARHRHGGGEKAKPTVDAESVPGELPPGLLSTDLRV